MRRNTLYKILGSVVILFPLLASCSGSNKGMAEAFQNMMMDNEEKSRQIQEYEDAISLMNETVDSIAVQQDLIFVSKGEHPLTREDVKQNLERYEAILKAQEEKINRLEQQLRQKNDSTTQTLKLISHLKEEIATKNQQILQLQEELENKNLDLAVLQAVVNDQQITINTQAVKIQELDKRTQKQGEALARQDAMLNNGYVLIGSKDDLNRKGITKKGKLLADAALDRTKFAKVDIRNWREISFTAKKPRILTNIPPSSYELISNGDKNYTLKITNPSDFWRISNYLVIQTD